MLCDVRLKSNSTVMLFRGIFGLESKEWFKPTVRILSGDPRGFASGRLASPENESRIFNLHIPSAIEYPNLQ